MAANEVTPLPVGDVDATAAAPLLDGVGVKVIADGDTLVVRTSSMGKVCMLMASSTGSAFSGTLTVAAGEGNAALSSGQGDRVITIPSNTGFPLVVPCIESARHAGVLVPPDSPTDGDRFGWYKLTWDADAAETVVIFCLEVS